MPPAGVEPATSRSSVLRYASWAKAALNFISNFLIENIDEIIIQHKIDDDLRLEYTNIFNLFKIIKINIKW